MNICLFLTLSHSLLNIYRSVLLQSDIHIFRKQLTYLSLFYYFKYNLFILSVSLYWFACNGETIAFVCLIFFFHNKPTNQKAFVSVICSLAVNVFFIAVVNIKWSLAGSVRDFFTLSQPATVLSAGISAASLLILLAFGSIWQGAYNGPTRVFGNEAHKSPCRMKAVSSSVPC